LGLPFVWGKTKLGDKGVTVCQVQQALIRKGFALDGVDGIFGEKTDYMIIKFQKANFLSVNAIADAATLKALGLNKIEKGEEDMLIIIGSKGPAVVAWQRALISAGFPGKMDLAKIKEDSPFGDATAAATMEFQAACGLPQTGKVDDATAAAMWGRAGDADIALLRKHLSEAMDIGQKASAELTALKTEFSGYKNNVASKKLDAKAALNALAATIEKL
jgi:peptidoglycan hydrolase-like protein with peptidoglycan-binding domain